MTEYDLPALLAPIATEKFFRDHWEQKPLLIKRSNEHYYDGLLSSSELNGLIARVHAVAPASVEIGNEYENLRRDVSWAQLKSAYSQGSTIRLRRLNDHSPSLQRLCGRLEDSFSAPVKANLYCTPANVRGSGGTHHDRHDVMILQIAGAKHWWIFEEPLPLPLEYFPTLPFEAPPVVGVAPVGADAQTQRHLKEVGEKGASSEVVLAPGDCLYLPRGFIHETWTSDSSSVHLSLGVHVITWLDAFCVALRQLAGRDIRLRRSLPVGFAKKSFSARDIDEGINRLIQAAPFPVSLPDACEEVARVFIATRKRSHRGLLQPISKLDEVAVDTVVHRVQGVLLRFVREDSRVGLAWKENDRLWGAVELAETFEFIRDSFHFPVCDLPGRLEPEAKIALARHLLLKGVFTLGE